MTLSFPNGPRRGTHPIIAQLRDLRIKRGIMQKDVAKKLGYSANQIYKAEVGDTKLYVDFVEDYANALGYQLVLLPIEKGK